MLFGGMRLCHSADSGETWSLADFNEAPGTAPWGWGKIIHLDHHEIVFDPQTPSRVYSTSDGGFARSDSNGLSWRHRNDDLQITGDGTQPLVLSGTVEEELPGTTLVKTGASHVTVAGS